MSLNVINSSLPEHMMNGIFHFILILLLAIWLTMAMTTVVQVVHNMILKISKDLQFPSFDWWTFRHCFEQESHQIRIRFKLIDLQRGEINV